MGLRKLADDDIVMGSIDEVEKSGHQDEVVQRFQAGGNMNLAVQQTGDEHAGDKLAGLSADDTRRFLAARFQRVARMAKHDPARARTGGASPGASVGAAQGGGGGGTRSRTGDDQAASVASASQVTPQDGHIGR